MEKDSVTRAIVVYAEKISSFAKQDLAASTKYTFELFKHSELLVNITKHKLVPKHTLLSDEEKKELLDKYKLNESQLPRILRHDPVARYYGLSRLQVVKITRDSETAGRYITYRIVW
jgi:DNA-directed RNA polymerase I, II, and III subunit RPABC1